MMTNGVMMQTLHQQLIGLMKMDGHRHCCNRATPRRGNCFLVYGPF
jgi:hypothetical protein